MIKFIINKNIKDPFKSNYQLLINERENLGTENLKNPTAFIDYSQTIYDVFENLEDYNPTKKIVLIVFDDMIEAMESNKKLSPIVTELFLRRRKLNTSLVLFHNPILKCLKL